MAIIFPLKNGHKLSDEVLRLYSSLGGYRATDRNKVILYRTRFIDICDMFIINATRNNREKQVRLF